MTGSAELTPGAQLVEVVPERRYLAFLSEPPDNDTLRELRMLGFQLRGESTRGLGETLSDLPEWITTGVITGIATTTYGSLAAYIQRLRKKTDIIADAADLHPIIKHVCVTWFPDEHSDFAITSTVRTPTGDWEVRLTVRGTDYRALVDRTGAIVELQRS